MYQCPLTGCHHFHLMKLPNAKPASGVCQCPLTGCHHFYPKLLERPVYAGLRYTISPGFFQKGKNGWFLQNFWFF
ncbi:hypothetical protein D7V86_24095 [bacterium D16-51]|nr:hypothetical protein D7V96_22030 [bacterium D16-59]RKI54152.1 hypothetical protein D7V86_24095 [bacterium D16-51]